MVRSKKKILFVLLIVLLITFLSSCSNQNSKRIVRVAHNQSEVHPTHIGLIEFEKYIEDHLGDKYDIELYPSELLGSQNNMVQLTQTGAIDFCVASNSLMETFYRGFEIFNLPYLFSSAEHYHACMNDPDIVDGLFNATTESGFRTITWLDAGTRNFYTVDTPIRTPDDLRGLKIRVQQSPTNIRMMELLGGSATPMGFGEVYTALQSGIIDGAENNEMALRTNGHGDVCKFYSYDMHQMVPDLVIANDNFLNNLTEEERQIFDEATKILNEAQIEAWTGAVEEAIDYAINQQGVEFIEVDTSLFQEKVMPLHEETLASNELIGDIYNKIMEKGATYQ